MSAEASEILRQALKLPQEARAAIAGKLIRSLDERSDPDAEAAWASEIDRRLALVKSGQAETLSWDEVRQHIVQARRATKRR